MANLPTIVTELAEPALTDSACDQVRRVIMDAEAPGGRGG
jgi:hypothetical protein